MNQCKSQIIIFLFVILSSYKTNIFATDFVYITTGEDMSSESLVSMKSNRLLEIVKEENGISIIKVDKNALENISHIAHEEHKRCGGYILHESLDEAKNVLKAESTRGFAKSMVFTDYSLNQGLLVNKLLAEVEESNIQATIEKMAAFNNRYYKSKTGVDSQKMIYDLWKSFAEGRSDFNVELYEHKSWIQPSVIATIKGKSDESIIIGGHGDSIAGFWGRSSARAPGADDNASGIATLTEVLRVLLESNYRPEKTIQFMSYAAEEVGLRGSKEIANLYKEIGTNVVGVLQLDMTNFNGSDLDIVMMTDYTNQAQNAFLGNIIDTYLPGVSWGYDKCGYACSDHASWTAQGYPASMPSEAKMRDINRNIHSKRDTIEVSGGHAQHALKFAKLGLSFALELDR